MAAENVFLPVTVNEVAKGEVVALIEGSDVLLRVRDFEAFGVRGFAGRRETREGEAWVFLSSLAPEVSFRLDLEAVTLAIMVPAEWLGTNVLDLALPPPRDLVFASDPSFFVNYSLGVQDFKTWTGFGEAGLSLGGNLLYGAVSRDSGARVVRGLTNVTHDDRESLRRWVLGDTFTSAGGLGGSLFIAGLSVSRNFSLNPYFVRYPTFGFSGFATTPSTLDVYVNGNIVKRQEVAPGTFQLAGLLPPAGTGSMSVVVRDAFGQERVLTSGLYASTNVLAKGLSEYTYNLGFRRDNLSIASWDYGPLSFLGLHRYGFSDSFTGEFRLEADNHVVSGGPGFAWNLPVGEIDGYVAASRDSGQSGAAGFLSYRFIGHPANFGVSLRAMTHHYAILGLRADQDRPLWDGNAYVGAQFGRFLSPSLQFSGTVPRDTPSFQRVALTNTSSLTRDLNLFVSVSRVFRSQAAGTEAFVGLSYLLGQMSSALASYSRQDGANTASLEVQKSLPVGTGFGYRFSGSAGDLPANASGLVQYNAPFGRYEATVNRVAGENSSSLTASGGIVVLGGTIQATRPVTDSFALIKLPGVGDVRGYAANQEVGTTDSVGNLLISNLIPYYGNQIRIADTDFPLDYEVGSVQRTIATPYRGGAVVTFPIRRITTVTGRILLSSKGDEIVPAYGGLTVEGPDGKSLVSPVGGDGGFYFEGLPAGKHAATLEYREAVCRLMLEIPASSLAFVNLGTVRCTLPPKSGEKP